jgi:hypothetical protein
MIVELVRLREIGCGYWGMMLINNVPTFSTLERSWKGNQRNISCIPTSDNYTLHRVRSPKFGITYEVPVEGRDGILIHKGNFVTDTSGCILIGTGYQLRSGEPTITKSTKAFEDFMRRADGRQEIKLIIR